MTTPEQEENRGAGRPPLDDAEHILAIQMLMGEKPEHSHHSAAKEYVKSRPDKFQPSGSPTLDSHAKRLAGKVRDVEGFGSRRVAERFILQRLRLVLMVALACVEDLIDRRK